MTRRFNQLTTKYRTFRQPPDAFYQSRILQTFFNKFTKKGKKALARRHVYKACTTFRFHVTRLRLNYVFLRILRRLHIQFLLPLRRKGKQMLPVPTPVRRNKRDVLNLQALYTSINLRRGRTLEERCEQELQGLFLHPERATAVRQRHAHLARVYEERVNMDYRWK
jgi:ribosomal protein S7